MRHRVIAAFVFLLVPTIAFAAPRSEVYRHAKAGTALIMAVDDKTHSLSLGSGFFVDQNGLLITNAHVIEDSTRLIVYVRDRIVVQSPKVVAVDPDLDLAALSVPASDVEALALTSTTPEEGSDVIAVGYPRMTDILNMGFALHPTVLTGNVNGMVQGRSRTKQQLTSMIQTTGHINLGNSGGPLVDAESGEVTGMVVLSVPYLERARDKSGTPLGSVKMKSGIGYSIPATVIRQWMAANHLSAHPTVGSSRPSQGSTPSADRSFATGHLLQTIAMVLPKDEDLYNLAVNHYETALSLRPNDPQILRQLGIAYAALGRLDDAIKTMRLALHDDPVSPLVVYELGLALEAKGFPQEAVTTWEGFLLHTNHPGDSEGFNLKIRQALARLKPMSANAP